MNTPVDVAETSIVNRMTLKSLVETTKNAAIVAYNDDVSPGVYIYDLTTNSIHHYQFKNIIPDKFNVYNYINSSTVGACAGNVVLRDKTTVYADDTIFDYKLVFKCPTGGIIISVVQDGVIKLGYEVWYHAADLSKSLFGEMFIRGNTISAREEKLKYNSIVELVKRALDQLASLRKQTDLIGEVFKMTI
jgi:hypothetical protein